MLWLNGLQIAEINNRDGKTGRALLAVDPRKVIKVTHSLHVHNSKNT